MHEPEMTAYLLKKFAPDTTFLDIGANIGYYTLLAAPIVKSVIAFEPQRRQRTFLEQSIEQAGYTNVTVYDFPLFSREVRGNIDHRQIFRPSSTGELVTRTLDSLALEPNIIKIDTEGAELDILMGAEETLLAYKPILGVEVHNRRISKYFGHKSRQVHRFLEELGYTISLLKADAGLICAEWES